jgi:hypothetical protein
MPGSVPSVLPAELDVLDKATVALVVVTAILAVATIILAIATIGMARNQRRELGLMEDQIGVTREQLRAHLELRNPSHPNPGELPTVTVEYVGGVESASDVWTWLCSADGRRFAKASNTPSPSRREHPVSMVELPSSLMPTWNLYFADIETGLELTPDSEWFAAVTWEAADKRRHGWMSLQRVDRAYPKEWTIDDHPDSREKKRGWGLLGSGAGTVRRTC